jgi:hypothetical protein
VAGACRAQQNRDRDKNFEELARWFNPREIVEIRMIAAN